MINFEFLKGNQDTSRAPKNNKMPCSCQTSLRNLLFHLVPRISLISTFNHQMFTYFVQRRSFLSSRYHLNLKQAFKVKNLVPMTMHYGSCHWSRALYHVLVRMLMQRKTPVTSPAKNAYACSAKNDTWSISGNVIGLEAKMPAKCSWDERSDGNFFWQWQRCNFLPL